jgi:hypothetical protein
MGQTNEFMNDGRQASTQVSLLAIMSIIITGLIVMAVLSSRACSV